MAEYGIARRVCHLRLSGLAERFGGALRTVALYLKRLQTLNHRMNLLAEYINSGLPIPRSAD